MGTLAELFKNGDQHVFTMSRRKYSVRIIVLILTVFVIIYLYSADIPLNF